MEPRIHEARRNSLTAPAAASGRGAALSEANLVALERARQDGTPIVAGTGDDGEGAAGTAGNTHAAPTGDGGAGVDGDGGLVSAATVHLDDDDLDDIEHVNSHAVPFACERWACCLAYAPFVARFVTRNRAFMRLALPSGMTQFLRNFIQNVGFIFAGRLLNAAEFGGFILGFSFANAIGVAVGMGVAQVLDTLCPQTFGRDPRSRMLGVHVRTALAITAAVSALYLAVSTLLGPHLVRMLKPELVEPATQFLGPSVLIVFGTTAALSVHKYLNAQHQPQIALRAYAIASVATVVAAFMATHFLGVRSFGLSLVIGGGRTCAFLLMLLMGLQNERIAETWWGATAQQRRDAEAAAALAAADEDEAAMPDPRPRLDQRCMHYARRLLDPALWAPSVETATLKAYLKLCGPSILASCADRWTFEVMAVLLASSKYRATELDAFGTLTTIWLFVFVAGVGCYAAGSTLVGNALGQGKPNRARAAARQAWQWGLCTAGALCAVLAFFPRLLLDIFVADEHIRHRAANAAPAFALGILGDSLQFVLQGVFRACGRMTLVSRLSVAVQWGVAIPLACALCLGMGMGLVGVGIAMLVGVWIQALTYMMLLSDTPWDVLAYTVHQSHHNSHASHGRRAGPGALRLGEGGGDAVVSPTAMVSDDAWSPGLGGDDDDDAFARTAPSPAWPEVPRMWPMSAAHAATASAPNSNDHARALGGDADNIDTEELEAMEADRRSQDQDGDEWHDRDH